MTIRKYTLVFLWLLSSVALMAAPWAWDDDEEDDRGSKLATSALVRTADLPADPFSIIPLPWGTDSLSSGSISVRARRLLEVRLQGAPSNMTYDVLQCNLSTLANRCTILGAVATGFDGSARNVLNLPAAGNTFAVFFALARGGMTQFVSGFVIPMFPPDFNGTEVELKGRVLSTNVAAGTVSIMGFAPLIFIDAGTKLKGISGLAELVVGSEVEVQGVTRSDGNIQAREFKVKKEKDD